MISKKIFYATPEMLDRVAVRYCDHEESEADHMNTVFLGSRLAREVEDLEFKKDDERDIRDILQALYKLGIVYGLYLADELESVRVQ